MELRQLEYFCMVSKYCNFTKAAKALHVSQPSITKAIQTLETELHVKLLDRNQKRVILTAEGEAFLAHAHKILHTVDQAIMDMNRFQKIEKGVIKLGLPPMVEAYLFPNIFTQFKQLYPDVELVVFEEGSSIDIRSNLETEELDLGLVVSTGDIDPENSLFIIQEELYLCVPLDHPLRQEKRISLNQLKDESFILQKMDSCQYRIIMNKCLEHDFTPNVVLCSSQIKTIKHLVANGSGISFLMSMVITDNDTNIAVVPLEEPIDIDISLTWKKNKSLSQASLAFIQFLKNFERSTGFNQFMPRKNKTKRTVATP